MSFLEQLPAPLLTLPGAMGVSVPPPPASGVEEEPGFDFDPQPRDTAPSKSPKAMCAVFMFVHLFVEPLVTRGGQERTWSRKGRNRHCFEPAPRELDDISCQIRSRMGADADAAKILAPARCER